MGADFKKSILSKNYDLQVRPIFKRVGESVEMDLVVLYNNSMSGTFTLEGLEPIYIEIRPSLIRKGFTGKNVTVNISKPGAALQKTDFKETLPYYLGSQIVVSPYIVIVDSISPGGDFPTIRFRKQGNQPFGNYIAGQSFIDLELPLIADTSKTEYVIKENRESEFYLVDFWGSWCIPALGTLIRWFFLRKSLTKDFYRRLELPANIPTIFVLH